MSTCVDLAVKFSETLSPGGMVPEPRRPARRGKPGASLTLHSRNAKTAAERRVEFLPIQQGGRSLLAFFVQMGRGKAHRSWWKDESIAEVLPRSAGGSYSVQHVRRWRYVLALCGLIRCDYVAPGGALPDAEAPDADTGLETETGQMVVSVNMEALLGLGPVWDAPARGGYLDAREAKAAAVELREELETEAAARAALEPDAPPLEAANPPEGVIMGDHPRVIFQDHPFTDLGSPSENNPDPARATSTPPGLALTGSRTGPLNAGSSREGDPSQAAPGTAPRAARQDERASRGKSRSPEPPNTAPHVSIASSSRHTPPTETARREREQTADQEERPATRDEQRVAMERIRAMEQTWLQMAQVTGRRGSS